MTSSFASTSAMKGRKCSRFSPSLYRSDGGRFDVATTVTPRSISAVNSRERIIASALLFTTISSNARQRVFFDDGIGNQRDRVARLAFAHLAHPRMDVEHEGVEMDPPFALDVQLVVEQVHQHRFAAPDRAPQIHAARPMYSALI
eukprot:Opistho-1_new@38618